MDCATCQRLLRHANVDDELAVQMGKHIRDECLTDCGSVLGEMTRNPLPDNHPLMLVAQHAIIPLEVPGQEDEEEAEVHPE